MYKNKKSNNICTDFPLKLLYNTIIAIVFASDHQPLFSILQKEAEVADL